MDISNLLTSADSSDIVEVYICPEKPHTSAQNVAVGWKKGCAPAIPKLVNVGTKMDMYEFHFRDLTYSYDKSNDAQRVVQRKLKKESVFGNLWGASYAEDVLPSHRFPSTMDIAHEEPILRTSYRLNNRMFLYHDVDDHSEYLYVRYNHAPNVDLSKMQETMTKILGRITHCRA